MAQTSPELLRATQTHCSRPCARPFSVGARDAGPLMRVSVLLACWNAAPYVEEAVQSVLDQRPAPFEIIAVDDGSTDRSAAVLEGFGTRLVLIRQANSGVCAALNRA